MNYNNICYKCFAEKPIADRPCPHCGHNNALPQMSQACIPAGTRMHNRYIIGVALGVGGFGITYKCLDTVIGGVCVIKEYFPSTCNVTREADGLTVSVQDNNIDKYNKILNRFVEEAELLKTFEHRNVVRVYDSFFHNNTAYYVMEYCDGVDLRKFTNNCTHMLSYDEGMNILFQVMNGLEYVHSKGILHRDIAPDNILISKTNTVKIIDFGSARYEMDQMNRKLSVIIKAGYAPVEQYGHGMQGPYTDVYALGATFYHLFTGRMPMESTQRVSEDKLIPFSQLRPDLPDKLKYCIEKSMAIRVSDRIADIPQMKRILGLESVSKIPPAQPISSQPKPPKTNTDHRNNGGANSSNSGTPKINTGNGINTAKSSTGTDTSLKPALMSTRICAYMIDWIVYLVLYAVILMFTVGTNTAVIVALALFPFLFTIINTLTELTVGTTLGKAFMSLAVKDKNKGQPQGSQIILRNIIKLLGCIELLFINNNTSLEDRLTDTSVYSKK